MRDSGETARQWLRQAEHTLEVTQALYEHHFWSDVCFMAEQTAQLGLKSFLYSQGSRFIPFHAIQELARDCAQRDAAFEPVVEMGKVLDRYYIPTRYPDALPAPAVPFESFTEADARQALDFAHQVVTLVQEKAQHG